MASDRREERRDVERTDRVVEDALRKHGPGEKALRDAIARAGKKSGGR